MKTIYLIKDLSKASGTSIYSIKYYTKLGLLKEFGRSPETNFRYFDKAALDRLHIIRKLRKEGQSLATISKQLFGTHAR